MREKYVSTRMRSFLHSSSEKYRRKWQKQNSNAEPPIGHLGILPCTKRQPSRETRSDVAYEFERYPVDIAQGSKSNQSQPTCNTHRKRPAKPICLVSLAPSTETLVSKSDFPNGNLVVVTHVILTIVDGKYKGLSQNLPNMYSNPETSLGPKVPVYVSHGGFPADRAPASFFPFPAQAWIERALAHTADSWGKNTTYGYGSKNRYQSRTLASGNMDQNLRNPSPLILSHCHMGVVFLWSYSPCGRFRQAERRFF